MSSTRSKSKTSEEEEANYNEVLKILKRLEKNVQDLKTIQTKMETKMELLADKLDSQQSDIKDLKDSANYFSGELASLKDSNTAVLCALKDQKADLNKHESQLNTLQSMVNEAERYSRSFNLRFLGIPEEQTPRGEDCIGKIESLLEEHLNISVDIENAHRSGRYDPKRPRPRHVIAKFLRRPERWSVFRQRDVFKQHGILVVEDLIAVDLKARRNLKSVAQEAYHNGKKVKFIRGDLYIDGAKHIPDT